jgi:DNA ligase-1
MTEVLRKLYKRTRTGAIQTWHKEIEGDKHRTVSGQLNGSPTISGWKTANPKNVGKSNETTGEEQAKLECAAEYTKKLDKDYFESIEEIDDESPFKPMLAESYDKYPVTDFADDVFSQPKLDGARCIATAKGLFTRQGKEWISVPHVAEDLATFFGAIPDAILDGELYPVSDGVSFERTMSLIKQKKPTEADLAASKEAIGYHVYDYPSHPGRFSMRIAGLRRDSIAFGDSIIVVETDKISTQKELDALNKIYLKQGYEGQMVRTGTEPYENRRTKDLKKRKEFFDEEYEIVEISEGEGNRGGMAGFITYKLPDGRTFGSGIKGSHDYCRELLTEKDKYVGGQGTVRFFEYTSDGVPRFPVTYQVFETERDI